MNVRFQPGIGPGMAVPEDVFLAWAELQDGKFEYDRGTIGMMVRVTQNHALIVSNFVFHFRRQLENEDEYQVFFEAFAVHAGSSVRFPDVLLQRSGADGKSLKSDQPLVIVEVLSEGSLYLDMNVKRDEYLSLPSLQAYIVASQTEPRLWIWQRIVGDMFPGEPNEFADDACPELKELSLLLPLDILYRGVIR